MMQTKIKFPVRKTLRPVRPVGRPKAEQAKRIHQICISVDTDTFALVSALADATGDTMAATVRSLMLAGMQQTR
jgi:hypothetical protein